MANIFTRAAIGRIMADEQLTPEQRTEQVFSLYGKALEDGYVSKGAARQALESARAEWEQGVQAQDVTQSEAYLALRSEFDAYRTMQQARSSEVFADVKPKFFEVVYGMVDRGDGAKPVREQLEDIRERFGEYFEEAGREIGGLPRFGAPLEGGMPSGDRGRAQGIVDAWGFGARR